MPPKQNKPRQWAADITAHVAKVQNPLCVNKSTLRVEISQIMTKLEQFFFLPMCKFWTKFE